MGNTEVEKFIQANTHELSKDKWLCPLSGKKFKGQDFVRKHIRTKHADKVEQVKMEVAMDDPLFMIYIQQIVIGINFWTIRIK